MFNNLSVIETVFHTYSSYLCAMPDTYKHIDHAISNKLAFVVKKCNFSKFRKKLNYFPTCKDFHN